MYNTQSIDKQEWEQQRKSKTLCAVHVVERAKITLLLSYIDIYIRK